MKIIELQPGSELIEAAARLDERLFSHNPWGADGFAASAANDYDCLFAGTDEDGVLLSYGLLRCFDDAEVIRIAVDPEKRRNGIGRETLRAMLAAAAAREIRTVFLEVRASNEPAIGLYLQAGFVREGIRKAYYSEPKEDAVIMKYEA